MSHDAKHSIIGYFVKQKCLLETRAQKASLNPDMNNVHDLRVVVRRLQSVLWLTRHGSPRLAFAKLTTSLEKLEHALGEQRQLDVAILDASKYQLKRNKLFSLQKSAEKAVLHRLNSNRRRKLFHQLERAIETLQNHPNLDLTNGFSELAVQLNSFCIQSSLSNRQGHKLRIAAKNIRYSLKAIGVSVPHLDGLQDHLGRFHDLIILQKLTRKEESIQSEATSEFKKAKKILKSTAQAAIKRIKALEELKVDEAPGKRLTAAKFS